MAVLAIGGIVGVNGNGTVLRTYAAGSIHSRSGGHGSDVGGIIGQDNESDRLTIVQSSVAINISLSAQDPHANVHRVLGSNWRESSAIASEINQNTLINNRAYASMLVNGSAITSRDSNTVNGMDASLAEHVCPEFWITVMGWCRDVWYFEENQLPTLRGIAGGM